MYLTVKSMAERIFHSQGVKVARQGCDSFRAAGPVLSRKVRTGIDLVKPATEASPFKKKE
jgi:hypothetical protein